MIRDSLFNLDLKGGRDSQLGVVRNDRLAEVRLDTPKEWRCRNSRDCWNGRQSYLGLGLRVCLGTGPHDYTT